MDAGKVESCSRIKDGNGRLALEEVEVQRIWKEYFEDLYNIDTLKKVASKCVPLLGFREATTTEET